MLLGIYIGDEGDTELPLVDGVRWESVGIKEWIEQGGWPIKGDVVLFYARSPGVARELMKGIREFFSPSSVPCIALVHPSLLSYEWLFDQVHDFLVEPFLQEELRLRLKRIIKKTYGWEQEGVLVKGDLRIDLRSHIVTVKGKVVDLTLKEYELLRVLMANAGKTLTRENLLNRIWGYDYLGGERTLDVHIRRLRAKLGEASFYIETVRGIGYRLKG